MRRFIRTSVFFLISLLCAAPGCDDRQAFEERQAQQQMQLSMDSLASAISAARPDDAMLRAFVSSAFLKLSDLSDYLNILADTATPLEFREQVTKLTGEMFYTPDIRIDLKTSLQGMKGHYLVSKLMTAGATPFRTHFTISPDSSWVIRPLEKVSDSLYSGALGFTCKIHADGRKDQITGQSAAGEVLIYLARKEKVFGESSRKVWSVFLGDIELK